MSHHIPTRDAAGLPPQPPDPRTPSFAIIPAAPAEDAASLLASFRALPRGERIAFLAALIRADALPSWRVVRG